LLKEFVSAERPSTELFDKIRAMGGFKLPSAAGNSSWHTESLHGVKNKHQTDLPSTLPRSMPLQTASHELKRATSRPSSADAYDNDGEDELALPVVTVHRNMRKHPDASKGVTH